jgi:hypothetical protein
MRHHMEFTQCLHGQYVTRPAGVDTKRPLGSWLPETPAVRSTPGVANADPVSGRKDQVYDAVDRRLMDTFPASDPVGRY